MKKILIISMILIVSCTALVFAESDDFAQEIAEKLGYSGETGGDGRSAGAFAVSKVWPYDETKTIVALAYPQSEQQDEGTVVYDLDIIIADSETSSVLARYTKEGALTSDAIYISRIEIDTGLYNLKKGTRAFGLRITYMGSSSVNQYESTVLNLYIFKGSDINCVLDSMVVMLNGGEWDQQCEGSFTYIERAITMSKKTTKGLRDIIVDGTVSEQKNTKDENGECLETESKGKPERFVVKFDGGVYKVPKEIGF